MNRRLRALVPAIALLVAAGLAPARAAFGAKAPSASGALLPRAEALGLTCQPVTTPDGITYDRCTGELPTFDGIGLDTDLSLPANASGPQPTILMLHGWSGDKNDWQSATADGGGNAGRYHWNNVWFASQGIVAVNFTARGFKESCGVLDRDANCDTGWTHLSDRDWEVRDDQTVLGLLVDAGIADPSKLSSTGGSYGGGQSWLLATSLPWKSPAGRTLQLAASVPLYPFTDLLASLQPNGRETDAKDQSRSHVSPLGVSKQSYVAGLYAVGRAVAQGRYNDQDPTDFASALDEEFAFTASGEPYDSKPLEPDIVAAYSDKSAYDARAYFDAVKAHTVKEVPVLSVQGWTDPLFPAAETVQMLRVLKAADPRYPLTMALGDIGHSNAQNPIVQWQPIFDLANRFLDHYLLGAAPKPTSQAYSFQTHCPVARAAQTPVTGTWDRLARGTASGTGAGPATTSSPDPNPQDGPDSDPIVNAGCLTEPPGVTDPGGAYFTWSAPSAGFTMIGLPTLTVRYALSGVDAAVGLKLWDVAADGSRTLVTRGVYRLTSSSPTSSGTISLKLYGNHWAFAPGHRIQLQLTQADAPSLRPDNLPSQITWSSLRLVIPSRQAGSLTLTPAV
jgi:predicted acyl esterase